MFLFYLKKQNIKNIIFLVMSKKKYFNVRMIVSTAILVAVEVVLQLLSMVLPTVVNLNLALVVITIGAILYGPVVGGFLGLVNGVVILLSPNTVTVFMSISPIGTILTCLLKTTIAGAVAGLLAKWINKKNDFVGSLVAAFTVPFLNTMIFAIFTQLFFIKDLGLSSFGEIFTILIGINFLFEVVSNMVIAPSLYKILQRVEHKAIID